MRFTTDKYPQHLVHEILGGLSAHNLRAEKRASERHTWTKERIWPELVPREAKIAAPISN